MRTILQQNKAFFSLFFAYLMLFSVLQLLYTKAELFLWVNGHYSAWADVFFRYYTYVGDGWVFALLFLVCLATNLRLAIVAVLSFATTGLASRFLKDIVFADEPRPRLYFEQHDTSIRLIDGLEVHSQLSFPSGHTITAFAFFSFICMSA